MRYLALFLICGLPALPREKAAYDSNGRIIALLSDSDDVDVSTNVVAVLPNGKRVSLQMRREDRGVTREPNALAWSANFQLPDGGRGKLELKSEEDAFCVRYSVALTAESPLDLSAIEFVIDVPRKMFLNGKAIPASGSPVVLAKSRPSSPVLYSGETASIQFSNAPLDFGVEFDQRRALTIVDRWDNQGRSFQLRAVISSGAWNPGQKAALAASLKVARGRIDAPPVHIKLDASAVRYPFDGFGGNYCWNNQSPITAYMLKNLKLAWGRTEMKLRQWDANRSAPGPEVKADMETMRAFHQMGVPYVISIWWLPERFYTDSFEKPRSAHFRIIDGTKWDELLDAIGGYLLYAKREYGVEPDLFSFNESNIGVYVGQTPEAHMLALRRIGAHFAKLGLKTKMLLGDATGPRDTHRFVLEAAADAEAMKYVGAIGFHSWGGGTAEQYAAWGDVGEWLGLPLLVTELGVDAAAYRARSFDSYHYGLREAQMTQELLTHARPQGTQFWQFTNDYALARQKSDGTVEPTARFWLMKHFTDLTPRKSEAVTVSSDQKNVLVTAFRKDKAQTIHILNLGPARKAQLEGMPGEWRITTTTEDNHFQESKTTGPLELNLPARALVTLSR